MSDSYSDTGLFALYLGPKSSFTGSFCINKSFLNVDFASQLSNTRHDQIDKDSVLWDGKTLEINVDCGSFNKDSIDVYSSNGGMHWSALNEYKEKEIVKLQHCNNFHNYHSGSNLASSKVLLDEFEDKIRYQIEKCNQLKGFVNIYDTNTGFGGMLSKLTVLMDDVFGNKHKLSLGLGKTPPNIFELEAVSSNSVCSFLDYGNLKGRFKGILAEDSEYHTSAILSLFVNQILSLSSAELDFVDLVTFLSPLSRNILSSFVGLPFDDSEKKSPLGTLFSARYLKNNIHPLSLLSQGVNLPLHHTYVSCCGIPSVGNSHSFFSHLSGVTSETKVFSSATKFAYHPSSIKLSPKFPQFFSETILSDGRLRQPHEKVRKSAVTELPVISMLQNSDQPIHLIDRVLSEPVNVNQNTDLIAAGVLQDDISEIKQHLHELRENYTLN